MCSRCGKEFFPTPEWAYKRGNKIFCGFPCSDADYKEEEAEKRRKKELSAQRARERARERYEKIKQGQQVKKRSNQHKRAILQFTTDGKFVAKFDSVSDAADAINKSPTTIVQCAKGTAKTVGGYVLRYADECEVAERDE